MPWAPRPVPAEAALCARYFWKPGYPLFVDVLSGRRRIRRVATALPWPDEGRASVTFQSSSMRTSPARSGHPGHERSDGPRSRPARASKVGPTPSSTM